MPLRPNAEKKDARSERSMSDSPCVSRNSPLVLALEEEPAVPCVFCPAYAAALVDVHAKPHSGTVVGCLRAGPLLALTRTAQGAGAGWAPPGTSAKPALPVSWEHLEDAVRW